MSKKLIIICSAVLLVAIIIASPGYLSKFRDWQKREISSEKALKLMTSDSTTVVLDFQSEPAYRDYHVEGAINTSLEALPAYAAENLPDKRQPIICYCLCAGTATSTAEAAYELLVGLGYKKVYHTSAPGEDWAYEDNRADGQASHKIVSGEEAKKIYDTNPGTILLDVRTESEYNEKRVTKSKLIPVNELEARLSELPGKQTSIIVFCSAGTRSKTACDILIAAGYKNVYDLQKMDNWQPVPAE